MVIDSITQAVALAAASLQMVRNMSLESEDNENNKFNKNLFQQAAYEASRKLVKRYASYSSEPERIANSIKLDPEAPEISFDEALEILGYLYEDAANHESANGKHRAWIMLSEIFISAEKNASRNILEELLRFESNEDKVRKTILENMRQVQELQVKLDELCLQLKTTNNLYRDLLSSPEVE